ncbi:G-type lectin S-receptor-like serine/threonine-protein kinase LECRK1 [Corylus avellana]|uniref:G-type lectin S-receptor-like serine/threonine-protein kinase LECRK1 n=1 Tax=Corylus avellana TaxID=13451 RepID=UPI00286A3EC3|nr:G-type lectin S-receptor-like serine/threonine-protein kinase LECRK1 [Corylus avellana]
MEQFLREDIRKLVLEEIDAESLEKMVSVGLWCIEEEPVARPSMKKVIQTLEGTELGNQEKSIANATQPAAVASLLDSGNFVLYDSNLTIIWQSFDYPTDTLLPGQQLRASLANYNELVSSSSETNHSKGNFLILVQSDGNIVMYPVGYPATSDYAYWATGTFVGGSATLALDGNGRLYVLNGTGVQNNITNESDGKTYRATIDADGIFRLYSHDLNGSGNWSIVWRKGIWVAIKISVQKVELPKNEHTEYITQELQNVVWQESTYATLFSVTKEECNRACLEDCNCEAAWHQDQNCRKQKLPLTLGRIKQEDAHSTATFFKVGIDSGRNVTKKVWQMNILIVGVACLAFALIVLAFSAGLIFRYRLWAYKEISSESNEGLIEDVSLRSFTYNELQVATNGFIEQLGRGSFGTVFKGTLSNGQKTIAVKRLEKVVAEGEVEFRNEMRSIARTHQKNLVRLLNYCHYRSDRLLVYKYMSNGTLADYLFKSRVKPNWDERIKIALNIARGIRYLHEECETQIIHCVEVILHRLWKGLVATLCVRESLSS